LDTEILAIANNWVVDCSQDTEASQDIVARAVTASVGIPRSGTLQISLVRSGVLPVGVEPWLIGPCGVGHFTPQSQCPTTIPTQEKAGGSTDAQAQLCDTGPLQRLCDEAQLLISQTARQGLKKADKEVVAKAACISNTHPSVFTVLLLFVLVCLLVTAQRGEELPMPGLRS
jgi:hypothetical protein